MVAKQEQEQEQDRRTRTALAAIKQGHDALRYLLLRPCSLTNIVFHCDVEGVGRRGIEWVAYDYCRGD